MASKTEAAENIKEATLAQTARLWLIRLRDDDISIDQITEWQCWVANSDAHRRAYERAEIVWQKTGATNLQGLEPTLAEMNADEYLGEEPVQEFRTGKDVPRPRTPTLRENMLAQIRMLFEPWQKKYIWSGLGLVASTLLMSVYLTNPTSISEIPDGTMTITSNMDTEREIVASIVTAKAEHRTAKLFDGSEVSVGADTHVSVDFSQKNRQVNLTSGEAYFDVAPDKSRPFIVTTPFGDVTAVGTAFNVRLTGNRVVVTVTEGIVDVRPDQTTSLDNDLSHADNIDIVRVKAGSVLAMVQGEGIVTPQSVEPAPVLTWREQRLVYRSELLKYVIADINRYSEKTIIIQDEGVGNLSYTGVVVPQNPQDWLEALPLVFNVKLEDKATDVIYINARE